VAKKQFAEAVFPSKKNAFFHPAAKTFQPWSHGLFVTAKLLVPFVAFLYNHF